MTAKPKVTAVAALRMAATPTRYGGAMRNVSNRLTNGYGSFVYIKRRNANGLQPLNGANIRQRS